MIETATAPKKLPIRVLVVEDSPSVRQLLIEVFRAAGGFEVVGVAEDGRSAVALTEQLRPDVITMDIHLSGMDGITATRHIMADTPTPIVIVSASTRSDEVSSAFQALQAGAVAVASKPPGPGHAGHAAAAQELLTTVRIMSELHVVRRRPIPMGRAGTAGGVAAVRTELLPVSIRPRVVALAASTGGPQAIQSVLQGLGAGLDVPIIVVQHMSEGFLGGMVDWLGASCPQTVRLAVHGERLRNGVAYVAPERSHLLVTTRETFALSHAPPVCGFRPSADVLLSAVAESYGAAAVGVVLTGMGEDGASGLGALKRAGALTIAQDEATSVVYGMPRAAAQSGAATYSLPLPAIGVEIRRLLDRPAEPFRTGPQRSAYR